MSSDADFVTEMINKMVDKHVHEALLTEKPENIFSIRYEGPSALASDARYFLIMDHLTTKTDLSPLRVEDVAVINGNCLVFQYLRIFVDEDGKESVIEAKYEYFVPKKREVGSTFLQLSQQQYETSVKMNNRLMQIVEDFIQMPVDEFTRGGFNFL
jgi:hypothetical protein